MTNVAGQLNRQFAACTDGATFYLYHPDDLQHRRTSPLGWPHYDFAGGPEFAAGRLVAFETGGDGDYGFRVTNGPLTEREQQCLASSWDFRFVVKHGRVFLDGGYGLPSDQYFENYDKYPEQWITLPNGNYRVTVNAVDSFSEPDAEEKHAAGDGLPSYVIQFQAIENLEDVPSCQTPIWMEPALDAKAKPSSSFGDGEQYIEKMIMPVGRYPLVLTNQVAVPGFHVNAPATKQFYQAVLFSNDWKRVVVSTSATPPCLAAFGNPSSGGSAGDRDWGVSYFVERLVTVEKVEEGNISQFCRVKALDRPASKVAPEQLTALKVAFAMYGRTNAAYREATDYPDFEIDRVQSLTTAAGVTHALIHHVPMPDALRMELLPLSDLERTTRLLELLTSPPQ